MRTKDSQQSSTFSSKSSLWFLAFSAIILLFPFFEPLRKIFNDYNYPPLDPFFRYILLVMTALLYLTYFMGAQAMLKAPGEAQKLPPWWLVLPLIYAAATPPLFSIDLYEYVIRGRMSALYGLNPFISTPNEISSDPLYSIVFWRGTTSCYGPLWNMLAHIFVKLSGSSDIANVAVFKAASLLAHLASGWLLYMIARKLYAEKSGYLAALFVLNPYLIFMNLVENHNDVFMILFMLTAIWLLAEGKFTLAVAALTTATAVKYITAILFPVFFIYIYNSKLSVKSKAAFTAAAGVVIILVFQAFSLPFGMTPLNILSSFKNILMNLETNTFPFMTYRLISEVGVTMSVEAFRSLCNLAFLAAASLICLSLLRKSTGGIKNAINACFFVFAAYLVLASFQFGNWYAVWLTPLILLSDIKKKDVLFILVTFAALIAFWKRINFLMTAGALAYGVILLADIRRKKIEARG